MSTPNRFGLFAFNCANAFFFGLLPLIVLLLAIFLFFVPVRACEDCSGSRGLLMDAMKVHCRPCGGDGRLTVWEWHLAK